MVVVVQGGVGFEEGGEPFLRREFVALFWMVVWLVKIGVFLLALSIVLGNWGKKTYFVRLGYF
jgi:hypothetical protein